MKEDNKAGREELYSETKYLVYIIPALLCSAYSTIAASTVADNPIWFYVFPYIAYTAVFLIIIGIGIEIGTCLDKGAVDATIELRIRECEEGTTPIISKVKRSAVVKRLIVVAVVICIVMLLAIWQLGRSAG